MTGIWQCLLSIPPNVIVPPPSAAKLDDHDSWRLKPARSESNSQSISWTTPARCTYLLSQMVKSGWSPSCGRMFCRNGVAPLIFECGGRPIPRMPLKPLSVMILPSMFDARPNVYREKRELFNLYWIENNHIFAGMANRLNVLYFLYLFSRIWIPAQGFKAFEI